MGTENFITGSAALATNGDEWIATMGKSVLGSLVALTQPPYLACSHLPRHLGDALVVPLHIPAHELQIAAVHADLSKRMQCLEHP